jgi:hypothetical protein
LWGNLRERDHLGDPDIDGTIIFRSSESGRWGYGLDLTGAGYGQVAGSCEFVNEHLRSIKSGELLY